MGLLDCIGTNCAIGVQVEGAINGKINKLVRKNSIYPAALKAGKLDPTAGTNQRTVVITQGAPAWDFNAPETFALSSGCDERTIPRSVIGTQEYTITPKIFEGKSQDICLDVNAQVFKGQLGAVGEMFAIEMAEKTNSVLRNEINSLAGTKMVIAECASYASLMEYACYGVDAEYPTSVLTDKTPSFPNWDVLEFLVHRYLGDELSAQYYGSGDGRYMVVIVPQEVRDVLVRDVDYVANARAWAAGSGAENARTLNNYFLDPPYRGIRLAVDRTPRRFNTFTAGGVPNWIAPFTSVSSSDNCGNSRCFNNDWRYAAYGEITIVPPASVEWLTYNPTISEGRIQLTAFPNGSVQFKKYPFGCGNEFENKGVFVSKSYYAVKPIFPQQVVSAIYARGCADYNTTKACPAPSSTASTCISC